jgi:hypothetical protein
VLLLFRRDTRRHIAANLAIAFGVACLLGFPGIVRFFAVREGVGAAIPDRSPGEVFHLLYWVVNLLVWIEVRFISPLALTLSVAGAVAMFRRHRAMSLLILALGLLTALSQIHLLRTHPFSVMRYFIPAQPILWIGLPFLFLIAPPPRLRAIAAAVFCVFIGVQAWNCTRLESTYGSVAVNLTEARVFVDAVDFVKAEKSPGDAVTFVPHERFAYRGEYFGLPDCDALSGPTRPAAPRLSAETGISTFDAPATWIVARVKASTVASENQELQDLLADLRRRHHTRSDDVVLVPRVSWNSEQTSRRNSTVFDGSPWGLPQLAGDRWLVVRVDGDGVRFTPFPLK